MTNEELDNAREIEAIRIYDLEQNDPKAHGLARIAARLAREGWTPPVTVDPDLGEVAKLTDGHDGRNETWYETVLKAIKRGRALAAAEAKPGVVWVKHDRSRECPVDKKALVWLRDATGVVRERIAGKQYWSSYTHYAVITPPAEDVA